MRAPPLPLELWTRIITHLPLRHLARTWFALRSCSRLLRAAAEEAYLTRHVAGGTSLVFDALGYDAKHLAEREGLCEEVGKFAMPFRFKRVDGEDRGRVVFGVDWEEAGVWTGRRGVGGGRNFDAWVQAVRWYVEGRAGRMGEERWAGRCRVGRGGVGRPDCPVYTVVVGRVVNDTELPGLEVDFEEMEVTFEWRGMLDRLLGEEEAIRRQCPEERVRSKVG
ncbi:hypothetical protein GTA08_BOTSDO02129 [Neofusicoccum parvum]|uniref:Uncharacterized protein n=1 Tax=Neofusicoccum parvum TaxID=310453 RepID=A0ACB5RXY4_9PEZI|nr:hypothetical protein GTA08_BOTSDO02129 [Neofusicoccum parvum]